MKRHVLLAAGMAALVAGVSGVSCTTPQPPLECSFNNPTWAVYSLTDAGTGGSCSLYEGDRIDFQRYLPPGDTKPTFSFLPRRVGSLGRVDPCNGVLDGRLFRQDPNDLTFQKEAPRGTYEGVYPNAAGFCVAESILPAEQNFPAVTAEMCADAGVAVPAGRVLPGALSYKDEWSGFRIVNTATFSGTMYEADVVVNRPGCSASYHVQGIYPWVSCESDEDCNPNANLDAGRAVGSGLQLSQRPVCKFFSAGAAYEQSLNGSGVCVPTGADGGSVNLDELAKIK